MCSAWELEANSLLRNRSKLKPILLKPTFTKSCNYLDGAKGSSTVSQAIREPLR